MTPDEIDRDTGPEDEEENEGVDYTYFCSECGHEQFDGELCEVCGSDEWEFVRLDEEGLRRRVEARGGEWDQSMAGYRPGRQPASRLTDQLEVTIDYFLDELAEAMYEEAEDEAEDEPEPEAEVEAEPQAADAEDEADEEAGEDAQAAEADAETSDGETSESEASIGWKRLAAAEAFREWIDTNREWLVQEVARSAAYEEESEGEAEESEAGEATE